MKGVTVNHIKRHEWHNTGPNGKAREVWVRTDGDWSAEIKVMSYRCLVTMYVKGEVDEDHEGIPFGGVTDAKAWADRFMQRHRKEG